MRHAESGILTAFNSGNFNPPLPPPPPTNLTLKEATLHGQRKRGLVKKVADVHEKE